MDNVTTQQTRRRCVLNRPTAAPVKTQELLFIEEQKRVREKWNDKEGHRLRVNFYKAFVLSSDSYEECLNRFQARLRVVQERIMHFLNVKIKENRTLLPTNLLPSNRFDSFYVIMKYGEYIRVDEMKYFKMYCIVNMLEEEEKDLYRYMNVFMQHCDAQGPYNNL